MLCRCSSWNIWELKTGSEKSTLWKAQNLPGCLRKRRQSGILFIFYLSVCSLFLSLNWIRWKKQSWWSGQDREGIIYIFAIIYLLALCLIGGKQGIKGCLGLIFTFFCVIFVYLPLVYLKFSPFWTAMFVCFITTLVTMYLIGGPTRKTCAATLGTLAGVVLAGISAWCFSKASGITGFNVSDIETLMTLWNTNRIQVGGLLFSGLMKYSVCRFHQ